MTDFNHFFIAGINYKKTDASIRGTFAIQNDQYINLLNSARLAGLNEIFVLSTCNRTEIYGVANELNQLSDLLCNHSNGSKEKFEELSYIKKGHEAIEHLFAVAAGLDSQILGDYEIVGQMKQAIRIAKENGCIGTFLERLSNIVLQSSKAIKTSTELSGGTVSVSFAAIQCIRENFADVSNKKIVLLGTGKIGRNTCKNLIDYLGAKDITLINRTEEKAKELAAELNIKAAPYSEAALQVAQADIVVVATNAEEPVIKTVSLINSTPKLLIDLSIPNNIEASAKSLPHITLVNVDDLSRINDITLQKRMAEVPKAKAIIAEHMMEFADWNQMRKNVPVLKAVKQKLIDMHQCNLFLATNEAACDNAAPKTDQGIQKVINNMAQRMREQNQPGCNYIEAINDYITNHRN
ncbi:MAG: glutamyl-tRNA reductase [Filimonas sp.]|nr:glutamyl-tRNA reductase [Filimonas sp.]